MGRSAAPTFYFGTPSISQKLMDLGSGSLVCLWDFMSTRVLCKNLSAGGGRLERSAAPNIFFILGPPPYLRKEWSSEVKIWYTV